MLNDLLKLPFRDPSEKTGFGSIIVNSMLGAETT
jgi:hypothetical protein